MPTHSTTRPSVFCAFSLLSLLACPPAKISAALPAPRGVVSISIDGASRSYIFRLPPAYDGKTKLPLVMLLHGATDSAAYAEEAYRFVAKSAAQNFVLVLPDAIGDNHSWHPFDADTPAAPNNDLRFLTTLLRTLPKTYAIDPARIFVCGHSSGAMMTYRLAADHPELIAAAGIVAGAIDPDTILPRSPVALIIFHGKLDPTLPFSNLAPAVDLWKKTNGCNSPLSSSALPKKPSFPPTVSYTLYPSPRGADIAVYVLDNGNHMWPGGKAMPGKAQIPVQDISATDLMWAFFIAHPRRIAASSTATPSAPLPP